VEIFEREDSPKLLSRSNLFSAVTLHVLVFVILWGLGALRMSEKAPPEIIEVVMVENPDGNEFEKPPEVEPEVEPEEKTQVEPEVKPVVKPEVKPEKIPDPPPKVDAVEKIVEKPKTETKKVEKPKPKKPTQEEIKQSRLKRIKEMRDRAKKKPDAKVTNGKTYERRPVNFQDLWNKGAIASSRNRISSSDDGRYIKMIYEAFYNRWDVPNTMGKAARLEVKLSNSGKILSYRIIRSSGRSEIDQSILEAASKVGTIIGLSLDFIRRNNPIIVEFTLTN
jgi:TonB family protein